MTETGPVGAEGADERHGRGAGDAFEATERDAWAILAAADGLGPVGLAALLAAFGTARAIVAVASEPGAARRLADYPRRDAGDPRAPIPLGVAHAIVAAVAAGDATLARLRGLGIGVVAMVEPAYPSRLARIALPPPVLYVRGDPASLDRRRAVAVVGTRRATTTGRSVAGRVATALVAARATVVSGLAYGIDGAAHESTIRAGGTTVAVIGGGHAGAAPASHRRLADAIIAGGGAVISEHPPDVVPSRGTFPRRNRIVSGLSDATVVIEAPARSGALITASWALDQGRQCFLVPGPIDAPSTEGCLAFLREWAGEARIVAGVPQLIADLGYADAESGRHAGGGDGATRDALSTATSSTLGRTEAAIADALVAGHATVDELVAVTDLPVAAVLATLTLLERRGLAAGTFGRYRPAGTLLGETRRIRGGRRR